MFRHSFSGDHSGAAGGSLDKGSTSIICPASGSTSATATTTTTTISNSCSTSSIPVGSGKRPHDEIIKEDKQDDSKKAKPSWSFSGLTQEVLHAKASEATSNGGVDDGKESNI